MGYVGCRRASHPGLVMNSPGGLFIYALRFVGLALRACVVAFVRLPPHSGLGYEQSTGLFIYASPCAMRLHSDEKS